MEAPVLCRATYDAIEADLASGLPVVAILPVGATESHGPHLPLDTDVVIAQAFAQRAAQILAKDQRIKAWVLPPLSYTPAGFASGFAGTFSISWETLGRLLDDIGASLKQQGFACLALANAHFDPANVNVLRQAEKRLEASGLAVAFADATRRKLAAQLTEEFQGGDCHGGQFETSIVLAAAPDSVKVELLPSMPDIRANLVEAIGAKGSETNFRELGMGMSYCGSPSLASANEGEASIDTLGQALADAVVARLFSTQE